jgi:hypothetical protein
MASQYQRQLLKRSITLLYSMSLGSLMIKNTSPFNPPSSFPPLSTLSELVISIEI